MDPRNSGPGDPVELMDVPDLARITRYDSYVASFTAGIGATALLLIVGPVIGALWNLL